MKLMEENEIADNQIRFQRSELLLRGTLKSVYVESRVACFRAEFPKGLGFIYFELTKFSAEVFSK